MEEVGFSAAVIVMLVVLFLLLFPAQNLFASVIGNFTHKETTIMASSSAQITAGQSGQNRYDYNIQVTSKFTVSPKPEENIEAIPVVKFKDRTVKMKFCDAGGCSDYFTINAGEKEYQLAFDTRNNEPDNKIASELPPIGNILTGHSSLSFIEGQEYAINLAYGNFKVGMIDIAEKHRFLSFGSACETKFSVECKDNLKFTEYLPACEDGETDQSKLNECTESVELCGGSVTIKPVGENSCNLQRAQVEIDALDGSRWDVKEEVRFGIYRKSACTDEMPVDEWNERCASDALLRNQLIYADIPVV